MKAGRLFMGLAPRRAPSPVVDRADDGLASLMDKLIGVLP
jgi:hypothetical protein